MEKIDQKYPNKFYTIVTRDAGSTGNLEISIELKAEEGLKNQRKIWIHQKVGHKDGFPSSDWGAFNERLECGVILLDQAGTCQVSGVIRDEDKKTGSVKVTTSSVIKSLMAVLALAYL